MAIPLQRWGNLISEMLEHVQSTSREWNQVMRLNATTCHLSHGVLEPWVQCNLTELTRAKTAWQSVCCTHLPKGQELYHPFTQDSSKKNEAQNDEEISAESYPWWDLGVKASAENFPPVSRVPRRREALVQRGWSHVNREACPIWGTHSLLPASWGTTPGKPHYFGLTF